MLLLAAHLPTPLSALRKKGDLSGGPTRVGGSQGTYNACPCFCDMLQGGASGEGPYWGFQLGVNQTEGANDLPATCHQDACFNVADHDMPFCKPYVEASGGMFCARQFNATLMGMTGAAYVTRLDQHVESCALDTLPMPVGALPFTGGGFPPEDGPIADATIDSTDLTFTPDADSCHHAIASAACHMAFPKCADAAEAKAIGPRPVCVSECVRERAMCRTQGSGFGSIEQIVKFSCGAPYANPVDQSTLCSGVSETGEPGSFGIYEPGVVRTQDNQSKTVAVSGFLACILALVGFAKWKFNIEKMSDAERNRRKKLKTGAGV